MSLARNHRDRILAEKIANRSNLEGGTPDDFAHSEATGGPANIGAMASDMANRAQAQIGMRLTADLRRLKEIQSIERKIEAKREMIPEYNAWIEGILQATEKTGVGFQDDIIPTIMVWSIDTGDWERALQLAKYVLDHKLALPARYERQPATLIVENLSEGAILTFERNELFPLDTLGELVVLADDHDMPDEVRAKLHKARGLGFAMVLDADHYPDVTDLGRFVSGTTAIEHFSRAIELNPRIGLKQKLEKLRKDVAALAPPPAVDAADALPADTETLPPAADTPPSETQTPASEAPPAPPADTE